MRTYTKILLHCVKVEKLLNTFFGFCNISYRLYQWNTSLVSLVKKELLYASQERNHLFLNVWRSAENNNYHKQVISKNLLFWSIDYYCLET